MPKRALFLVPIILLVPSCHAPGGGLFGQVTDDSNAPVPNASIVFTYPSIVGMTTTHTANTGDDGSLRIVWSHGSWLDPVVEVSAPGFKPIRATIGGGYRECTFRLAPEGSTGQSSASCRERQ